MVLHPEQNRGSGITVRLTLCRVRDARQLGYIAFKHDPRVQGSTESCHRLVYLKTNLVVIGRLQNGKTEDVRWILAQ